MGYGITIRVSGPYAQFTRPEMKVDRVSYDVITPSAARGIIEAVYWKPAIRWRIEKIHVLNPIQYTNILRNEVENGICMAAAIKVMEGRKKALYISSVENRVQRASMILKDVDYVIEACFDEVKDRWGERDTKEGHYNIILRRLRLGQYFQAPCLGTREFPAKVEIIEDKRDIPKSKLEGMRDLGWMLYDINFIDPQNISSTFFHAEMQDGVIDLTNLKEMRQ
jgi:CRISPR-associated protein Cas5d